MMKAEEIAEILWLSRAEALAHPDGLPTNRPFAPFFHAAWAYARRADAEPDAITAFLDEISGDEGDQSGDDKTLVLAVRDGSAPASSTTFLSARPVVWVPG